MLLVFGKDVGPIEVLGVPAAGFVLNTLFGNFRHSNLFLRFPKALEKWFLSPAQHQIHHSIERAHWNKILEHGSLFGIVSMVRYCCLIRNRVVLVWCLQTMTRVF